jgi:hypothetical protein
MAAPAAGIAVSDLMVTTRWSMSTPGETRLGMWGYPLTLPRVASVARPRAQFTGTPTLRGQPSRGMAVRRAQSSEFWLVPLRFREWSGLSSTPRHLQRNATTMPSRDRLKGIA